MCLHSKILSSSSLNDDQSKPVNGAKCICFQIVKMGTRGIWICNICLSFLYAKNGAFGEVGAQSSSPSVLKLFVNKVAYKTGSNSYCFSTPHVILKCKANQVRHENRCEPANLVR